jgi:hypothetical protein
MKAVQRRILYGLLFGFGSFLAGWGATYFAVPGSAYAIDAASWRVATWWHAGAHFVPVAPPKLVATLPTDGAVDVLAASPEYRYLRAIPPVTLGIGGGLAALAVGGNRSVFQYLLNAGTVVLGYLPLSFLAIAHADGIPNARLVVSAGVVLVFALLGGAFLLKSSDSVSFQLPLFSPGYIAAAALLTVFGTVALAQSLWTIVVVAFVAAPAGGLAVFVADRLPK